MDWYIVCGDSDSNIEFSKARCGGIAKTFAAEPRERPSRRLALILDLAFFAAAGGVAALIAARSRGVDTSGLNFVFWVLFLNALRGVFGYFGDGIDFPYYEPKVSVLVPVMLLCVFGALGVVLNCWPPTRAKGFDVVAARAIAARAIATTAMLCALFVLYLYAIHFSDKSQIIRGVVICLALIWELVMSGERLNLSVEHHIFSRSSRIFILIGYLLLVATAVFLLTDVTSASGTSVGSWNTELIVANGIALLGGALVASRAMRSMAALVHAGAL